MHKLLAKQMAKAAGPSGEVDVRKLAELVSAAYEELDRDRRRTDRSIALMIAEVEASQKRLLDALDVVPEGFAVFDADGRYVLWNRQYEEMYPESRDLIAVGKRFEDVLREGVARGQYPDAKGREQEWIADRLARHAQAQNSHEQRLPGGRWVRVQERRTADGGSIGVRVDITSLKQREASFRLLFDSNPIPMWVVDIGTLACLAVNDAAVAHYGYSREQFLAMTAFDLVAPDEHDELRKVRRGRMDPKRVWHHVKADSSVIDVHIYSQSLTYEGRAAAVAAAIDCTEARRAESELRTTREFLDTVIENIPVTIVAKDTRDFRYLLINRAGEQYYGIPRSEMIGKTAHEVLSPAAAELVTALDRKVLESGGKPVLDEHTIEMVNGRHVATSIRVPMFDDAGQPRYLLVVVNDITERKQAQDRIDHLARHDSLTDLPNRLSFGEQLEETLGRAAAANEAFAVVSVDLDRFKEVNDVFGHAVGDALLLEVTKRLSAAAEGAFVARLGGDEFGLIAANGAQPATAAALSERLMAAFADDLIVHGQSLKTGLSVGVAVFPADGKDVTTLLANADAALHRAKSEGRGSIRFFASEMDLRLRERRALQHDLRAAIEHGDLTLDYQPQARVDGKIIGFEALVRWRLPERGPIPPGKFVPVAEESGLIIPMGEQILRNACREAATWASPLQIAVNLSPVQFRDSDLPAMVHAVLLETGLDPGRLELEITRTS